MSADWTALEDALFAWVKGASGFSEEQILWLDQDGPRPAGQHIGLRLGADAPLGSAPELTHDYDAGRPAGAEIVCTVKEVRELSVTVQVFGGATTTSNAPRAIAGKLQTALGLPTVREALGAAGLSVFDRGRVLSVPEVLDADFEARAVLTIRCYVADDAEESTTFIETVDCEGHSPGETFTVDLG
jgi:hypothetical protein